VNWYNLQLFRSHALVKAQAKEYVIETQIRLILQPVIDGLITSLSDSKTIENCLAQIVEMLRGKPPLKTGYVSGNIINLLRQLQVYPGRTHLNFMLTEYGILENNS
jgi:hypothetical protein